MRKTDLIQLMKRQLKESASTECSFALNGLCVHTKLTLEAIDFIWTYLVGRTRGKWLLR